MKQILKLNSSHNRQLGKNKSLVAMGLVPLILMALGNSASASTSYEVPADGLSFNADDTVETSPCTAGYANSISWSDPDDDWTEADEINGLIEGESVTFENVATVSGRTIDARVTLTAISGMRVESELTGSPTVLDRLDKCAVTGSDAGLMEVNFRSITATPGEASFVLTIQFLENGSNVTLTNLKMNVEDIDVNQYLEVDNFTSARLAAGRTSADVQEYENGEVIQLLGGNSTALSTSATAKRFHATGVSSSSDPQSEQDKHVAEITYASVSSLVLKLGVYEAGGGSFDLNFSGFTFVATPEVISGSPTPTPTPTPTPAAVAATPQLARTGAGELPVILGITTASTLLIAAGTALLYRRRKLSQS